MTYEEAKSDLETNITIGGLDVNKGWVDLVVELHQELSNFNDPEYKVDQVKEKFGGLRFYFTCSDENYNTFAGIVFDAETVSYETCEVCGSEGRIREERAWILTLCDADNIDKPIYVPKD